MERGPGQIIACSTGDGAKAFTTRLAAPPSSTSLLCLGKCQCLRMCQPFQLSAPVDEKESGCEAEGEKESQEEGA